MKFTDKDGKIRNGVEVKCSTCSKTFVSRRDQLAKYCSRKCHAKSLSFKRILYCAYCGNEFVRHKRKLPKGGITFCCREHKDLGQRISSGIIGIRPPHYRNGENIDYRGLAFANLPNSCRKCGWDLYKNVLEVHHLDGNRDNNDIRNLEILCPTCHVTTHKIIDCGRGVISQHMRLWPSRSGAGPAVTPRKETW